MSPTYKECKSIEERQERMNKEWKRRAKCAKTSINITIESDTKKKKIYETIADRFRVNREKIKPRIKVA